MSDRSPGLTLEEISAVLAEADRMKLDPEWRWLAVGVQALADALSHPSLPDPPEEPWERDRLIESARRKIEGEDEPWR